MRDVMLITGGAGYVGSHLTRKLVDRGYAVRVLDSFLYGDAGLRELAGHPQVQLVRGDICDTALLERAVEGVRGVVALAALVGDAACDLNPDRTHAVNFAATERLLEAARRARIERLVFASSCSVYGANGAAPIEETSALNPVSLYARTRIMSEDVLLNAAGDVSVVILRLATVCGVSPRMRFDLMVNTMTACAATQGTVRVSAADQWRPHIHVQDAAEAFLVALEAKSTRNRIFNAGSDAQNFTIGEVAEKVAARMGARLDYARNSGDRRSYRVSFARIREELGFEAQYTVDDAIEEVRRLIGSGAITDFTAEQFHNAKWLSVNGRRFGAG